MYALTNALQPVRRAWTQAVGRALAGTGVSMSLATAVLITSRFGSGVSQKTLALEIGMNPAALVRILDQGEAAGLLIRNGAQGDRRSKLIDLLPAGRRLAEQMERTVADLRDELLGDLASEEVETATRVLRRLEERAATWLQDERAR